MSGKPMQAVLNLSEAARCLGVAQAKNDQGAIDYWTDKTNKYEAALTATQQQGQAVVCPACGADALYECVACSSNNYPPQPTQQGSGEVAICPSCERPTEIRHCQSCGADFINSAPPSVPVGWKLVPVEPAEAMREAFHDWRPSEGDNYAGAQSVSSQERWEFRQRYAALLAAAPALAQQPEARGVGASILGTVKQEIERATAKFPTWPTDPLHACGVVQEESGELAKAVLQAVYEPHKSTPEDVATEAFQTAAMAIRFLASMDRYDWKPGEQHEQGATPGAE